jgi:hypothetical protein
VTRRHVIAILLASALLAYLPASARNVSTPIRQSAANKLSDNALTVKSTKGHPVAAGPKVASKSGTFAWTAHPLAADAETKKANFAEPSIDVDHSGGIYVTTNGGAGVQMWRSWDLGKTFDYQEIPSQLGGGDSEIEFLSNDVGFTADLEVTDSAISRSTDRFETWTQQGVGIEQDRQWLAHRCSNIVLFAYHDFVVEAEMVNRSTDGGLTWRTVPVLISPKGSAPGSQDLNIYANQQVNTFSGPIVVDQKTGDAYIGFAISSVLGNATTGLPPFGEPEQIIEGVSHDEGQTWQLHLIKAGGPESKNGLFFPWTTIDRAGNVYAVWSGSDSPEQPTNVYYSYSTDHGETWSPADRVNTDSIGHAHIYASVSGGDPGVVDLAWYTSSTPDPANTDNEWYVDFAQIRAANTPSPQVLQSRVYPASIHHGEVCLLGTLCLATLGDRSLLDFFQVQIGPDGMANIAFANNGTPKDNTPDDNEDNTLPWYARQAGGLSAGSAQHDSVYCAKAAGGPAPRKISQSPTQVKGSKTVRGVAGAPLPGTGVAEYPFLSWVLLGTAVAIGSRYRLWRRRA